MPLSRLTLAAALVVLGAPATAFGAEPAGSWIVKGDFGPALRYTLLCVFDAEGVQLSGPCVAAQGPVLRARGSQAGDRLRFNYVTEWNDSGLELDYSGHLQADGVVKGVVENRLSTGLFQGTTLTAAPLQGPRAWSFDVLFTDAKYSVLCGFEARGSDLSGPCVVQQDAILQAKGSEDAGGLAFAYDTTFQGQPVHVEYRGARQPDGSIRGTITSGGSAGVFTALRK
jgi:hypothetical protein